MKIAIVQGAFLPVPPKRGGAVEKIWFALGQEFARAGHEVVQYSRLCDGLPAEEIISGVRHVRVPGADAPPHLLGLKWQDLLYTRRVAARLTQADIVVTNTFWGPLLLCPRRHGPLWVHVQRYPRGQMRFYGRAARLQTVSRVVADAIVRQAPSTLPRVCIIPNPLPSLVAPKTSVERDPNLVLFVGRIHPEKGLELLVEAAALARRQAPHLRFRIVGPWEPRFGGGGEAFQKKLETHATASDAHVEFAGPVFEEATLAGHFASASAFVYPSLGAKSEASPLAPLEALARGCPVLTSDLTCFDDLKGPGNFAHRFDHESPDAAARLLTALTHMLSDREAWPDASAAAQAHAGKFTLPRIAADYLAGFASLQK